MPDPTDDIITTRLVLRLMEREVVDACLAGNLAHAGNLLGAVIPSALLDRPSSLEFARERLNEDADYRPWSARAIILPETRTMVGHVRFHSRPDPDYLRTFVRAAVEFGYSVFPDYRRRGYASEAVGAAMAWAQAAFGVSRFIASVSPDNVPSLALIARFGFGRIGQHIDEVDGIENVYLRDLAK